MAQRTSRFKRSIVIVAAVVVGLGGAGAAYAYWTAGGTGDGGATTGTAVGFTITSVTGAEILAPGGPGQTVAFTVHNAATSPQYLTAVAVTIVNANGTAWVPTGTCDPADYHATITTAPTAGNVAANGGTATGTATVTLDNTAANQNDCKGQAVPLHFVAS